ncbi:TonB C-terminal domain-containing protein [Acinetobacter bereziniae]|uniref:cell envelope integrity protein TolA n=1 Tax=Acinetobacter bereziniae TaxID=106648 RepID=UPI00281417DF|nr:TonB C-terminal domain-containing protein [Acinetobacter bereziniae]MDQ9817608.1 TonB C-terminal domain-containing protein [Acinetobacter bereziniae]
MKFFLFIFPALIYQSTLANQNSQNTETNFTSIHPTELNTTASALEKKSDLANEQKAKAKKLAFSVKKEFAHKILRAWHIPIGATEQKANARIKLTQNGSIDSIVVSSAAPDVKASIEQAIYDAAPFTLPTQPEVRRDVQSFSVNFIVE